MGASSLGVTVLSVAMLFGCVGDAVLENSAAVPLNPSQVSVTGFSDTSQGLPAAFAPVGAAQLDGTLYLATDMGLYAFDENARAWTSVLLPTSAGERPTALVRSDLSLFVAFADPINGSGGVAIKDIADERFAKTTGVPDAPVWGLARRSGVWRVATSRGLWEGPSLNAPLTNRSMGAPFDGELRAFVAAAAQQRMFVVDRRGVLLFSDDIGATWQVLNVGGQVKAVVAAGAGVLIETDAGGHKSDNYGATFSAMGEVVKEASFALTSGQAFAMTPLGLHVSDDGGATWVPLRSTPPPSATGGRVFLSGSALVVVRAPSVFVAQIRAATDTTR
jgi:hypothetical protein